MTNPADCPLVDSHFHIYERTMPLAATAWHAPTEDATVERCLATLDQHGVSFGVVSAASIYGTYNDYVRRALRANRRLRGTAMVDLAWDEAAGARPVPQSSSSPPLRSRISPVMKPDSGAIRKATQ
jgi:predicted TIM-barrel fold metal-dependent hydrolase